MENQIAPKWMIKTLGVLIIFYMVLLVVNQFNQLKGPPQILRVSALGKVTGIPDLAIVSLGVTSEGSNPIDVKNKNNQKINQIIAFIQAQGIDKKDIQTTGFYASPKYNYANGQSTITGYQADQTITVKIYGVDQSQIQIGKILDGVVNNGANQIQGINFSFSHPDQLRLLARKQAIQNAKEKAAELANATNLKLGRVINVIESPNDFSNQLAYPAAMNFSVQAKSVAPHVEPGNQEVTETLALEFQIE